MKHSQCDRILALLRTGPKTTRQILDVVPSIVHSRIANLREKGYEISCTRTKGEGAGGFLYTLLSEPSGSSRGRTDGSLSGVDDPVVTSSGMSSAEGDHDPPFDSVADSCAAQLSLIEAA